MTITVVLPDWAWWMWLLLYLGVVFGGTFASRLGADLYDIWVRGRRRL